ncbi:D-alanyl-D-alanine carboxypeptidase [Candidatus Kuenenbacteria bacterium]|nr:D-alanyl-D-alanine carboxypeptidase [Candidatus Kuenenbacteria bacterium]
MLINLLITLLLLNPMGNVYFSNTHFFDIGTQKESPAPERINPENVGVKVSAERYVAIDVNSGKLLIQKNSNVKQPIASITKLMTALVILDQNPDWQMEVEMNRFDETIGAYPHIYRGEKVKFIDLWKSALVASDNNSIMTMIRALGFSRSEFAELMTEKALELEMYNTKFADPTGLDKENVSTALDVARMVHLAMQKNEIRESVLQGNYIFKILNNKKTRKINNTDILVDSFLNNPKYGYELVGGKTGFLTEAGYCLAVEISKEDNPVVIVVLNSNGMSQRFQDVKVLADWVYSNYEWK